MADLTGLPAAPAFSESDRAFLRTYLARARRLPPGSWVSWWLDGYPFPIGWMSVERAEHLARALPDDAPLERVGERYIWKAADLTSGQRSATLKPIAEELRDQGLITGWRDETYSCWGYRDDPWPYPQWELFRLERAAFRYFGLRSHAAHVHGITTDGLMWCGRRAQDKTTDPGLLDNLAAGGIPAGEDPKHCAAREVFEEAGLVRAPPDLIGPPIEVVTERTVPEGWHSERLFVWSLTVDPGECPANHDGEVSEYLAFDPATVISLIRSGALTDDAACAIAASFSG